MISEPGCNANQQLQPSAFQPQPALRQLHDNEVAALANPCLATSWVCKKLVRALLPEGDIQQDHQTRDGSRSQCGCHPRLQDRMHCGLSRGCLSGKITVAHDMSSFQNYHCRELLGKHMNSESQSGCLSNNCWHSRSLARGSHPAKH